MALERKARLRRPAILRNRRGALLKRGIVKLGQRRAMMNELRKRLRRPDGWLGMGELPSKKPSLRLFRFGGVKVVIKDTLCDPLSGVRWQHARQDFLMHQKAVRSGAIKATKYILRSPKAYGLIGGNYLIMEYIDDKESKIIPFKSHLEGKELKEYETVSKDFYAAMEELDQNLFRLEKHGMKMAPQASDLMTTGKYKGKWVFYLPYDYA